MHRDEARDVAPREARAEVAAAQGALLGDEADRRDAEHLLRVRQPDGHDGAAAPRRRVGLGEHGRAADRLDHLVRAAAGQLAHRLGDVGAGGQRRRQRRARAPGRASTRRGRPRRSCPRPRPGRAEQRGEPDAAEAEHRDALARLDARPRSAPRRRPSAPRSRTAPPSSNESSGSTFTAERAETTTWSQKAETPRWWLSGAPAASCSRRAPESSVPAAFAALARLAQPALPRPARGRTRCRPGRTRARRGRRRASSSTPGPISTTSPAASWPSTIGITRGREPSITERSEWQSPAARTRTRISPGPGPSSSSSASSSGRDDA